MDHLKFIMTLEMANNNISDVQKELEKVKTFFFFHLIWVRITRYYTDFFETRFEHNVNL